MEETGENHQPFASYQQTLSYNLFQVYIFSLLKSNTLIIFFKLKFVI